MFEKASRKKLRFSTPKGSLSVEDLWDLPLTGKTSLDGVARSLNRKVKENEEESFVAPVSRANTELKLKFELVKHVIKVRLEEKEKAQVRQQAKEKKQQILQIIADKETEALKGASVEELKSLLESL